MRLSSTTATPARRVHRVHLTAPSRALIGRGRLLLEDALHTVSLPAADSSQLLFIRHLDVGSIHSAQSSATLSRQLEQKLRQMSALAIPGTHPNAPNASVVTFPNDLTAYTHFAHHLATGQPLTAWFWPHLFASCPSESHSTFFWHPTQSRHDTIKALLAQLAAHPLAPLATATVLQQLHHQRSLTAFLELLHPEDGSYLLSQQSWTVPTVERTYAQNSLATPDTFSSIRDCHWPQEDTRLLWAVAMGLIAKNPTQLEIDVVAIAHQFIRADCAGYSEFTTQDSNRPETDRKDLLSMPEEDRNPTVSNSTVNPQNKTRYEAIRLNREPSSSKNYHPANQATPASANQSHNQETFQTKARERKEDHLSNLYSQLGIHTNYAGLFYLLNVLGHLHFPTYLPRYNAPTFPHILLHYVATRLQVPAEDPTFDALARPLPWSIAPALSILPFPHSPILHAWYSALRTHTYRHTHLCLKALISRPGYLAFTRTHIDITLDLSQVDIHIRKAGLDLNPGWLPWFGKVVQFHYEPIQMQPGERL